MTATPVQSSVKIIGANGQISLGKQFAGRQVLVEEREPGVWLVRTATVIPDNERAPPRTLGRNCPGPTPGLLFLHCQ